jgi:nickel transport protein
MPMQTVRSLSRRQAVAVVVGLLLVVIAGTMPAAALDLFARHEVTVEFATADGKAMANAEVRVFAPGERNRPALTGHTDSEGKFQFGADRDGWWSAEARAGDEVARATVRVGGQEQKEEPLSPYLVIGALAVLLVVGLGLRMLRARGRRRPKDGGGPSGGR